MKNPVAGWSFARHNQQVRDPELLLQEGLRAGQFGENGKPHGDHAMGFVRFPAGPVFGGFIVDLGSGAGLPGLILADAFPDTRWLFVERRTSRADLLRRAVRRLEMTDRIQVIGEDAKIVGWSEHRGQADWVTARSFGPPGLVAEMAAPLLRSGGFLVVSEPHDTRVEARWPTEPLSACGLTFTQEWSTDDGRYVQFERNGEPIPRLPRKGANKRLLF